MKYYAALLASLLLLGVIQSPSVAQQIKSASGKYVVCQSLVDDVQDTVLLAAELTEWQPDDWYSSLVLNHAALAINSGNTGEYIRNLEKSCLKVTT